MPTIIFNGKTYNNINDMPADERQAYDQMSSIFLDKDGNGIPDFMEGNIAMNVMNASTSGFVINSKTYASLDDMPEDTRNKMRSAFDALANAGLVSKSTFVQMSETKSAPTSQPAPQTSTVIEEERGGNTFTLILGGMVLCFALAAVAMAVFYLMNR
ncbi:MAG: hypothetical protein J0M11_06930 [Anaerolineae bacterium]|nr:hypothetical protein [Anaerolineae bacterium]